MSADVTLQLDDQLLLDDADHRVVALLAGRTDRLSFRLATVEPMLGGAPCMLLQTGDALFEAREADPEAFGDESATVDSRVFERAWTDTVRTERARSGGTPRFGRGRCAWYTADDGTVAVLVEEDDAREAIVGVPLAPGRIDLSFTESLRRGGRD